MTHRNPLLRYGFASGSTRAGEITGVIRKILTGTPLREGSFVGEFEERVRAFTGSGAALGFSAARMALYSILQMLREPNRNEVILPAYTCVVMPTAILYAGCTPAYVDIEETTLNLDVGALEDAVTPRTRAILAPHNFGNPCDIDAILAVARRHGLAVIEDCALALGATIGGRPVGSIADFAIVSTDMTKTISTSVGGLALVNDPTSAAILAERHRSLPFLKASQILRIVTQFCVLGVAHTPDLHRLGRFASGLLGRSRIPFFHPGCDQPTMPTGYPYPARLPNILGWIGLRQMDDLERNIAHRRAVVARYEDALRGLAALPHSIPGARPVYARYPILVEQRDRFIESLSDVVRLETWFDPIFHMFRGDPRDLGYTPGQCPVAESVASRIVNLPTHPRVDERFLAVLEPRLRGGGVPRKPASPYGRSARTSSGQTNEGKEGAWTR